MGLLDATMKRLTGSTFLHDIHWDRVVLDECHLIRNGNTTRTRYVLALQADIRWGLTATPINNGIQDYFCLLRFLNLNNWAISHVFNSHHSLQKYLSRDDHDMAKGKSIDLNAKKPRVWSAAKPYLTHQDITLRRTKGQVFSKEMTSPSPLLSEGPTLSTKVNGTAPHLLDLQLGKLYPPSIGLRIQNRMAGTDIRFYWVCRHCGS